MLSCISNTEVFVGSCYLHLPSLGSSPLGLAGYCNDSQERCSSETLIHCCIAVNCSLTLAKMLCVGILMSLCNTQLYCLHCLLLLHCLTHGNVPTIFQYLSLHWLWTGKSSILNEAHAFKSQV
jgi:hypothetical protein